jgi:plastocyanin
MKRIVAAAALTLVAACGGSDDPTGGSGVASVKMNANAITLLPGQSDQLAASALDRAGNPTSGGATTWRSGNTGIATVTQAGVVTGVAVGQTDVTATIDGKVGATRVTVGAPPTAVTVSMPGNSFSPFTSTIKVGGTVTFEFPQTPHNVIFTPRVGAPTDIQVTSNVRIPKTFGVVGLFPYDCTLHDGMKGEVNVVP